MVKRKPYQKPEIKQVDLVPEEAVLTGCKTQTGVNTGAPTDCAKNPGLKCLDITSQPGSEFRLQPVKYSDTEMLK